MVASIQYSFSSSEIVSFVLDATIANASIGTTYTAETFDATTGTLLAVESTTANGSTLNFPSTPALMIVSTDVYDTLIVTGSTLTPSPTTAPTATPTPTVSPSTSPTASTSPSPTGTMLFASNDVSGAAAGGIAEYSAATGALVKTFASATLPGVENLGADDAGNLYALSYQNGAVTLSKLAIGSDLIAATYTPSSMQPLILGVSPTGEVVLSGYDPSCTSNCTLSFDVWDPGKSGAPSRTLAYPSTGFENEFALGTDGTLYVPYFSNSGVQQYDVIPPGKSSPSRTIVDTLAPDEASFVPNFAAVGPDGTLYIGEWSFESGDPDAGLYVYPPSGKETVVTSLDPGINGLDIDGAGNVYVASDNGTYNANASTPPYYTADTAQQLSVYSPGATKLLRQFDDGTPGVGTLTTGLDGTAYLDQFSGFVANGPSSYGNIVRVAAGSTTASTFIANIDTGNVALFDGTNGKDARRRTFYATVGGNHASPSLVRLRHMFRR